MWWPQLEASVKKIMEAGSEDNEGRIRSDRELLEEVLSLTRMSMRRNRPREREIGEGVLKHLLGVSRNLSQEASHYSDKDILDAANDIIVAVRHIARKTDMSDFVSNEVDEVSARLDAVLATLEQPRTEEDDEIPF